MKEYNYFPKLKRTKDFFVTNCDTDSISFIKPDQSEFSEEEIKSLLKELNEEYPEKIVFADDGVFETVIIVAAKNYVLKQKGKPVKYKGASLKATTKEKRLQQFIKDIIKEIGLGTENYLDVYNSYVKEILNIKDISGWCTKKTLTEKVLNGTRTNETKVLDAIEGSEYREGDKFFVYFKKDKSLGLKEKFDGDYDVDSLLKKLYNTIEIFENVIDISQFPNYALKKNKKLLDEFLNV